MYLRLVLVPLVFLLVYALSYLINPYSEWWKSYQSTDIEDLLIEILSGLLVSWGIIEAGFVSAHLLEGRLPWTRKPLLRFLVQVLLLIIGVSALFYIQHLIESFFWGFESFSREEEVDFREYFIISIIIAILSSAIHTAYSFLEGLKASMTEASDLKQEAMELKVRALELKEIAMQAELQSLKLQLDPHFMFNNFSVLSELIAEDKATAIVFLENISRVYRYMILNLNKHIIQLADEIKFVEAYIYLIKIRLGDLVCINIDVSARALLKGIPPITLQLLIENAIKHNIATEDSPLHISIGIEGDRLQVVNSLQRISYNIPSAGIGLENISNRYRILSGRLPEITETSEVFLVSLPLLDF